MKAQRLARALALAAVLAGTSVAPTGAVAAVTHSSHARHRPHRPTHRVTTVTFTARVVRSTSKELVVRTTSGKLLTFSSSQMGMPAAPAHSHAPSKHAQKASPGGTSVQITAGNVVVDLLGLQPGALVVITETTDASGTVTITIKLPPPPPASAPPAPLTVSGVITNVDSADFTVEASDGTDYDLYMSAATLSQLNLQSCDTVTVTYHQDAGILIADSVTNTGTSATGGCAPTYDVTGTISQASSTSLTINGDGGPVSFSVDPSSGLTDGFQTGDLVDVTYTVNPDGSFSATNVAFVEESTSGVVTAVTATSLTVIDDNSGQSETFIADPSKGVQINADAFTGIPVGDDVSLCYHVSAGQLIADSVTDSGPAQSSGGSGNSSGGASGGSGQSSGGSGQQSGGSGQSSGGSGQQSGGSGQSSGGSGQQSGGSGQSSGGSGQSSGGASNP